MQIKDRQIQLCPLLLSRKDFFLNYTDNFFISPALGLHKYVYMLTFISRFPFLKSICNLLPNFKKLFIYLFLAALGLHCCALAFFSCSKQGQLFVAVCGVLTVVAVASLVSEHELQTVGSGVWCMGLVSPWIVESSWTKN